MVLKASTIFYETLFLLRGRVRRLVHQGGQGAGKTVNILIALAVQCSERPGIVVTVTSQSFPHLRAGALRDFERYVFTQFNNEIKSYHKTDHIFTWHNGSIIEFKTYDNEFAARGARRDILFINEANTFDYMTYFQLDSRSAQTIIDYNPTIRFWAHEKLIGERGTELRISDHRHNPFLTPDKHAEIESICTFAYGIDGKVLLNEKGEPIVVKGDYELWKVYARGMTGNVTGLIFPNWIGIDSFPEDVDNIIYSIDYGYTNDPTAIVKIGRRSEDLFFHEVKYQIGSIPPKKIKDVLVANGYVDQPLYSEHDPDMIKQLKLLNLKVIAARKGIGSIKAGIEKTKEYRCHYTFESRNIKKETGLYLWEKDEDTGKFLNTPIDMNNHMMDAIRYGVYTHYYRSRNAA